MSHPDVEPWFRVTPHAPRPLFSGRDCTQRSWMSDLKQLAPSPSPSPSQSPATPPAAPSSSLAMNVGAADVLVGAETAPAPLGASTALAVSAAASSAFIAAAARLDLLREELLENARHEMVELALQIARRVIGDHVGRAEVDLQPVLGNALSQIAEGIQATVRIHPASRHMVEAWMVQAPGRSVRIVADATLQVGDVVVESDGGSVDGRLQTRLTRAEEEVRRALGG